MYTFKNVLHDMFPTDNDNKILIFGGIFNFYYPHEDLENMTHSYENCVIGFLTRSFGFFLMIDKEK